MGVEPCRTRVCVIALIVYRCRWGVVCIGCRGADVGHWCCGGQKRRKSIQWSPRVCTRIIEFEWPLHAPAWWFMSFLSFIRGVILGFSPYVLIRLSCVCRPALVYFFCPSTVSVSRVLAAVGGGGCSARAPRWLRPTNRCSRGGFARASRHSFPNPPPLLANPRVDGG